MDASKHNVSKPSLPAVFEMPFLPRKGYSSFVDIGYEDVDAAESGGNSVVLKSVLAP